MSEEVEKPEGDPTPDVVDENAEADDDSPLHPLQKLLDNPWLLLFLGFVVPFFSYTVWGWVEILLTKKAELP